MARIKYTLSDVIKAFLALGFVRITWEIYSELLTGYDLTQLILLGAGVGIVLLKVFSVDPFKRLSK